MIRYPPRLTTIHSSAFKLMSNVHVHAEAMYFNVFFSSPRMASGMQEKQYTPSLLGFFIYNPKFGPREGEVCSSLFQTEVPCVMSCY